MTNRRRFTRLASLAFAGAGLLSACLGGVTEPGFNNPAVGRTVLFLGNSLTYFNDLPVIVQGIADAAGGDSLWIGMYAVPDAALIDLWNNGSARERIESRSWEFVVLQQGPSSTDLNRDTLRLATGLFAPVITTAGGKPVLFSAWPTAGRRQDFTRAAESYRLAAQDVGGLYAPVAAAWIAAWSREPNLGLYASDGLHPSYLGSYLSALVLYSKITGRSPVGLPATFPLRSGNQVSYSVALTTLLQEAAWEAVVASNGTPPRTK